ncbi:hypothetical protein HLRTI_000390, partial [Halorhabdus tiamatea SARL4B]
MYSERPAKLDEPDIDELSEDFTPKRACHRN